MRLRILFCDKNSGSCLLFEINGKKCKLTLDTAVEICKNMYINGKYYQIKTQIYSLVQREGICRGF